MFFVIGFFVMVAGFILAATSDTYYNVHKTDKQEGLGQTMIGGGFLVCLVSVLVAAWQILP